MAGVGGAEEGRGKVWRQFVAWAVAGLMSLLVVGCGPGARQTISLSPTLASTLAPMLSSPPTGTPLATPTTAPTSTATPSPTLTEEVDSVRFTIVYDNNEYDSRLKTAWGFACWVEIGEATVLFDTGGDSPTLLGNMATLGLDPQAIDVVVLSHIHGDHTGGLAGLLDTGARPTVYVPAAFPVSFKDGVRARTDLVEVTGPLEILPGVHTTGELGSNIVEQALVVETEAGLVVVTGCAHPGVVEMVRRSTSLTAGRAQEAVGGEVALVMGGFHLGGASAAEIATIVEDFQQLGVQGVAPCHCSGDVARALFEQAYGEDFISAGVGSRVQVRD